MLDFPRWKIISLHLLLALGVRLALPSVLPSSLSQYWPSFLPEEKINLVLDLAGGSHILLEADPSEIAEQRLDTMADSVRADLRRADPRIATSEIRRTNGRIVFTVDEMGQVDAAREVLNKLTSGAGLTGQRDWNIQIVDDRRFILSPTDAGPEIAADNAMETATDVIRRRIDEVGTRHIGQPTVGT